MLFSPFLTCKRFCPVLNSPRLGCNRQNKTGENISLYTVLGGGGEKEGGEFALDSFKDNDGSYM